MKWVILVLLAAAAVFAQMPFTAGSPDLRHHDAPSASSPWTPQTPTNTLVEWLRMEELSGHANGDIISNWVAKVGQNATNYYTDSSHNAYYTNSATPNGWPGLYFGGSQWLQTAGFAGGIVSQPLTFLVRWKFTVAGSSPHIITDGINSTERAYLLDYSGAFDIYSGSSFVSIGTSDTAEHTLLLVLNAAASTYRFDLQSSDTTLSTSPGTSGPSGLTIATYYLTGAYFMYGYISEYILYSGILNSADKSSAMSYLNAR